LICGSIPGIEGGGGRPFNKRRQIINNKYNLYLEHSGLRRSFLFPLYLIQEGGYGPKIAGFFLALHGVGTLVARHKLLAISRKWGDRRTAYAAILLTLLGSLLLFFRQFLDIESIVAAGMLVRGAGIGVLTILAMSGAYQGLTRKQVAQASSLTRIVTHLGATIGAAIVAVLAASSVIITRIGNDGYIGPHIALMLVVVCGFISWRLPDRDV